MTSSAVTPTVRTVSLRPLLHAAARTLFRGVVALPLAVAAVPMALLGAHGPAARAQTSLAGLPARRPARWRVLVHSVAVALPALVSFVAALLVGYLTYAGYLYFLRPDASFALGHPFTPDERFHNAWGGPTLVGAWFVHSCVALGMQLAALGLIRGALAVQGRATRRLLAA
ncbi:hypothetical protein GCM10010218_17870 [Streptomyces mashuensis]|uniref:Uncharacterized protein n=1 Tax=Streptomyces mashuensis TaxID=33904 RepID=A0A919B2K1_9ACTN|nr:hypothetical protein [Streptomyces mashuensis]GHF36749.1 hypothetical protein GCM10010218_17870 [Streptomyces mashuensis]